MIFELQEHTQQYNAAIQAAPTSRLLDCQEVLRHFRSQSKSNIPDDYWQRRKETPVFPDSDGRDAEIDLVSEPKAQLSVQERAIEYVPANVVYLCSVKERSPDRDFVKLLDRAADAALTCCMRKKRRL